MMAGTHKTQTRKTFAMTGKTNKVSEEDIIERFEDGKPKVWIETEANGKRTRVTQHEGFKSREPENSILKTIQNALKVPEKCPECGKDMRDHEKKLNYKFYFMRGKCFDCVLREETKIKQQGGDAWKKYQKEIMLANAESWFKDADKEVEILKTQIKETIWGNAQGETETMDTSAFIEKMEKDYEELKDNIRNSFME